jgi:predicted ABC-class ATPase
MRRYERLRRERKAVTDNEAIAPGSHESLRKLLHRIDGRGYKAYRDIEGEWDFDDFVLTIDHAQSDPFAAPSRVRALITTAVAGFKPSAFRTEARSRGTACYLAHAFASAAASTSRPRGTGRSGEIRMTHAGQLVLDQTAVFFGGDGAIEARFTVGLPGRGRRIAGSEAVELLINDVPSLVRKTLLASAHDGDAITRHASANEDATELREALGGLGLVAFVADGARLARRSGVDDRPRTDGPVVDFRAPESLRVQVDLPNVGMVTGMGVPEGVTLIVGGGFHGKSTLLRALQTGVWNHRPGDGRELVVARRDTTKIRAEDGRPVAGVDITPFIVGLPFEQATDSFSTGNASGSTSQAAAIVEALEAGARTLLVDEDTSATNFMIRDRRMQHLVPADGEPITPLVDRVGQLHTDHGVSTVLVVGGSGDYLDVADLVIRMTDYLPEDVTSEAEAIVRDLPTGRLSEPGPSLEHMTPRHLVRATVDPGKGRRSSHVKVPDDHTLLFGTSAIDITALEQLCLRSQIRGVGLALAWAATQLPPTTTGITDILDAVEEVIAFEGLDALGPWPTGDVAEFRRTDLAGALNRLRGLRVE